MQLKKMRPTRFAHFEGHTDICYTDDGRSVTPAAVDVALWPAVGGRDVIP